MPRRRYTVPIQVIAAKEGCEARILEATRQGKACLVLAPDMISPDGRIEVCPVKRDGEHLLASILAAKIPTYFSPPRKSRGAADLDGAPLLDQDRAHHARHGRGYLRLHLVRAHLEQRLVRLDALADLLAPDGDRPLLHRLAQLRHHHVHQPAVLRMVSTIRSTEGMVASSSASAAGSGTWGVVMRTMGPSRS